MPDDLRAQIKAEAVERSKDARGRALVAVLVAVAFVSLILAGVALYAALSAPRPVAPPCPSPDTVPRWVLSDGELTLVCVLA